MSRRKQDNKSELLLMLRALAPKGEEVVLEHRFHPTRQFRFDYAILSKKIAVEYQGHGAMAKPKGDKGKPQHFGGHASVHGLGKDAEKLNEAQRLGWRVIVVTALHFRETDRAKHKLTNPYDTIAAFLNA